MKNNVISAKTIATLHSANKTEVIKFDGIEITVNKYLDVHNIVIFRKTVEKILNEMPEEYAYDLYDFAINMATIIMYTNISTNASIEDECKIVYLKNVNGYTLVDAIKKVINMNQYKSILATTKEYFDKKAQSEILSSNMELAEVMDEMNKLSKVFSDIFEGVDMNEFNNLLGTIANNGYDEEKIIKAIVEANK